MGAFLSTIPAAAVIVFVVFRYGPGAMLTLLAGVVAVLARDPNQGRRALAVLRLLTRTDKRSKT